MHKCGVIFRHEKGIFFWTLDLSRHTTYYLSIFCIINTFIYCYETIFFPILLTVITLFNTKHLMTHIKPRSGYTGHSAVFIWCKGKVF